MTLLTFSSVTLIRGLRVLLHDADLQISAGKVIAIFGTNGSGKTTTLRAAAGLSQPFSGSVLRSKTPISFLGHELGMNSALGLSAYLTADDLSEWQLEDLSALKIGQLSAGQKKRAALARTCDYRFPLWVLDEPFANLDAQNSERLADCIVQHRARGGSVLMSAHQAPLMPHEALNISNGKLIDA